MTLERLAVALALLTGMVSVGVGVSLAAKWLQSAQRAYRKTQGLSHAFPDGWGGWFVDGFSLVTLGTRWLGALALGCAWLLAGACFIGLGLRLWSRV